MIRVLLKKQMYEIFKGYFYDSKKNKSRTKISIVLFFGLYIAIMVGVLGGIFGELAHSLCRPLLAVDMGWLYFCIMGMIAIALGTFGSIFNTLSGLYLSKDNDLLLSMPIPVNAILVSRLLSVYLLGFIYSAVVSIPTGVVYLASEKPKLLAIIGGIVYILMISVFVFVLSVLLGIVVAKLSRKLKNKSFYTVVLSLLFIALYYFVYFKAQTAIQYIIQNATIYGKRVRASAYILYAFGRMGEGNLMSILEISVGVLVLAVCTYIVLAKSFIGIVTSSGTVAKAVYVEKKAKMRSQFAAVYRKELGRFTSSPNYMLNCSMGILMLIVLGIVMLVQGERIINALSLMFQNGTGTFVILCTILSVAISSIDITSPSVSLEGKSIWLTHVLPVSAKTFLDAKLIMQLSIAFVPTLFAGTCICVVYQTSALETALLACYLFIQMILFAVFGLFMNLHFPNLSWTNEIAPIKQSLSVLATLFGGFVYSCLGAVLFFSTDMRLSAVSIIGIELVISAILAATMYIWIVKTGTKKFEGMN